MCYNALYTQASEKELPKISISDISADIMWTQYQLNIVSKYLWQSDGGRISDILRNFIPDSHALNSEHFTYWLLNKRLPSAGQTMWLHHSKSLIQAFFAAL